MQGAHSPAALLECMDDVVAKEWASGGPETLMKPLQRSDPTVAPELLMGPAAERNFYFLCREGFPSFIHVFRG